jgi:hypothetical protein
LPFWRMLDPVPGEPISLFPVRGAPTHPKDLSSNRLLQEAFLTIPTSRWN